MSAAAAGATRRHPPPPIPLTLLTGFLGAGKTTLLNRLVRDPAFARAVVIINEFGAVPIDHLLVEAAEGGLLTLSSGCICCTVRGELVSTLEDLLRRRDNGRMPPFDRLVVETTGLAEAAPILNALLAHPYLPLRYRVEGVVTVVDALHGAATLAAHHEAVDQVAMADVVVLSKTDLPGAEPAAVLARLAVLNPEATVLRGEAATGGAVLAALAPGRARFRATAGHPHRHGEDGVASLVLRAERPLGLASVAVFFDLLRARAGAGLMRVKGLVATSDDPERPLVVQAVGPLLHPARRLPAWPDDDRSTRLVVIGRAIDAAAVMALWEAVAGDPGVDRPDAAALRHAGGEGGPGLF